MDVKEDNFWRLLPSVLSAVSEADFVSIDLEMTGIRASRPMIPSSAMTMQQAYHDLKEAAEGFQILQVGLTCGHFDTPRDAHLLQTFNFYLTPMFTGKDNVSQVMATVLDRKVCFSYASLLFLRSHGFRLDAAFDKGIPYLSRHEDSIAQEAFLKDDREEVFAGIEMESQVAQSQLFYHAARESISAWVNHKGPRHDFLNIKNPYGGKLNRFQLRLVNQIIRVEFPDYRAQYKESGDFIQVVKADAVKDHVYWQNRLRQRNAAVKKQTGFRFVIEALAGGKFADEMDLSLAVGDVDTKDRDKAILMMRRGLRDMESKLHRRRPILVGHNQIADLCFLYRTFIGPLPDRLGDFAAAVHGLFPRIVDTKYMATRGGHAMLAEDNLEDLFAAWKDQPVPPLDYHALFRYTGKVAHEAGYDSMMTAIVMLKSAYRLARDKAHFRPAQPEDHQAEGPAQDDHPAAAPGAEEPEPAGAEPATPTPATASSRFATSNPYGLLGPGSPGPGTPPVPDSVSLLDRDDAPHRALKFPPLQPAPAQPRPAEGQGRGKEPPGQGAQDRAGDRKDQPAPRTLPASIMGSTFQQEMAALSKGRVPDWDTDFWKVFGNKVRMGGAGVVVFGPSSAKAS